MLRRAERGERTAGAVAPPRAGRTLSPFDELRVAPSILAADYSRLGSQLDEVLAAGARVIHVDVMDGHFVPPITVGPLIVAAIRDQVHAAGGVVDVHLMIESPERQVDDFARAGADGITIHWEASAHAHRALQTVHEAGCRAGLAINPGTPASALGELGDELDLALCMTVNPGWGGQSFIAGSPDKVTRMRRLIGAGTPLQVDGGIDPVTAPACAAAGATLFVAGSAVLGADEPGDAYRRLAKAAGAS